MKATEEFLEYVNQFNNLNKKIVLKKNHTLRVVSLCEEIARELKLSQEEIELVKLCGLLHDIGRFEQINRYDSYDDLSTLDHGDVGEMILKKDKLINRFSKDNHNTILRAVKYHNKYRVPNTLNEKNKLFVNITRDADKIDILNYMEYEDITKLFDFESIMHDDMSDIVYDEMLQSKVVNRYDAKTTLDDYMLEIGFVYDVNYDISVQLIKKNQSMDKLYNLVKDAKEKDKIKDIKDHVDKYMNERISNIK